MNVISYCAAYKRKACTVNVYSWTLPSKASASLPHTKLSSVKYLRHCAEDIKKKRKIHCSYRVWSLLADHGRNISSRGWTFLTADISCKVTLCGMWKKKKKIEVWELTQPYVYKESSSHVSTLLYTASALYHSSLLLSQDSRSGPVVTELHNTLITTFANPLVGCSHVT